MNAHLIRTTLPRVSILCSWYNRADHIETTVDSLLAQAYANLQVLVTNDGSTDERVTSILDSYDDPRLTVAHQNNSGFTKTICRLIETADGEFICVTGAGDRMLPEKTARQVAYMIANPEVGAVGCGHVLRSAVSGRAISYEKPQLCLERHRLKDLVPFTHGTVMYRASVLRAAGNYDEFFPIGQDRDLYWRISAISEIHGIDEALYEKFIFADGVTVSPAHLTKNAFFGPLIRNQDRELIDYYRQRPDLVSQILADAAAPRYLRRTVRRAAILMIRGEHKAARPWVKLALAQLARLVKARPAPGAGG